LIRLVSVHKVENITIVTDRINKVIQEINIRNQQNEHYQFQKDKNTVECMDRWLFLRNNTEDGTVK